MNKNKDWFETWFNSTYYYDLYANRDAQEATNFIHKLLQFLQPTANSIMLDVGCGRGRHVKTLADKGFDVTGIDISPAAIAQALKYENDKMHFYVHDMRLPFWINYFDYVFNFFTSFGYFATLREHNDALRTICQALKHNGHLIIDYLNVPFAESKMIAKMEQHINNVHYTVEKQQDKTHFYKTITVDDTMQKIQKRYTEKVAKFYIKDFEQMLAQQGLQIKHIFGDYNLSTYHTQQSSRMIMIAVKGF